MDEKRISELMRNLDNDLMLKELDEIMTDINIDVESISQKAHWKLRKEQNNMSKYSYKKKVISIVAASLFAVCGVTAVYASEVSGFIQSLMGKTSVHGTIVEGKSYYLAEPIVLDDGHQVSQVLFDKNILQIQMAMANGDFPDAKIRINGIESEFGGTDGESLFFYDLEPTSQFDLIMGDKSYLVQLTSSNPVVDGSEIVEAEPGDIPWISMGYKKIAGGMQILAAADDPAVEIVFLNTPSKDTVRQTFDNTTGSTSMEEFLPMLGYDKDGNAYEFHADDSDIGHPLTKFITDAPAEKELTVKLPSIAVTTEKELDLKVPISAVNNKQDLHQTIDLGLQKMQLDSIERTSDTTAQLRFTLNTGEQESVRIWSTFLHSETAQNIEALWENGTCVMDVTFPSETSELPLHIASPMFIVDGNWTLIIQ